MDGRLTDDSEDVVLADDEQVLAVEFDFGAAVFGNQDVVAVLDGEAMSLPSSSLPPVPSSITSASCGFSLAVSGRTMPPALTLGLEALDEHALAHGFDVSHVVCWFGCWFGVRSHAPIAASGKFSVGRVWRRPESLQCWINRPLRRPRPCPWLAWARRRPVPRRVRRRGRRPGLGLLGGLGEGLRELSRSLRRC